MGVVKMLEFNTPALLEFIRVVYLLLDYEWR